MNAILSSPHITLQPAPMLTADFCLSTARKRGLQRTLQALLRENLLNKDHLIIEGAVAWLPLWTQQAVLRFEGLSLGRIGDCQLNGSISLYRSGKQPQPVVTAAMLISCIVGILPGNAMPEDIERLIQELDNSVDNDALCLTYRQGWAQELNHQIASSQQSCFISALRDGVFSNPVLLLEQWGTLGHPWHPTYKTKLGLTAQEVVAMSPEFQPTMPIVLAAIRATRAHVAMVEQQSSYCEWFATSFPEQWTAWQRELHQAGLDSRDWLPLPLHPLHADKHIPKMFAREIEEGDLKLLRGVRFTASPTMSFRTVVPERSASLPHMKLPVSLRLTSVERTVSPKSAVMGPRLTKLLNGIVAHERGFHGTLDIVGESIGLHYLDPDGNDDRARHLSVLYRANPAAKHTDRLFPVPVGALFSDAPETGRPLVTQLISLAYGDHASGALQFYEQYASTVLEAMLSAYLIYGIAFEAHQQNSFIMLNPEYQPVQILVRDFGDLRIHYPTLRRTGLDIQAHRAGHTVFDSNDPVRDKLIHAVLLCHLSELALLLSRTYHHPESSFWNTLRHQIDLRFECLRARTDPSRWTRERHHIFEAAWPAKSFLRMRLLNTSDDMHGTMPNPLRDTPSARQPQ